MNQTVRRFAEACPNGTALSWLAGSLLIEQNDEWLVARRYFSEASMAELTTTEPTSTETELQVAEAHRQRWW